MTLSLLDLEGKAIADWWVVFRDLPDIESRSWLWRTLKPGFRHVELWKYSRGLWVRVEPCMEVADVEPYAEPPWRMLNPAVSPTFMRAVRLVRHGRIREPFFFGPWTCVELAKSFLGIRAFFVRTPYQLYKTLRKQK